MILRPPRSTRTDTLFPYTTLFRSSAIDAAVAAFGGKVQRVRASAEAQMRLAAREHPLVVGDGVGGFRSEEHTSELQSLMRISYAVFCLKKKTAKQTETTNNTRTTTQKHNKQI